MLHPECNQCNSALVPYFLQGINQTIYGVITFGIVPYLVKPQLCGTAYGLLTCAVNFASVVVDPSIAFIHDRTGGYFWVEVAFTILFVISFILKLWLYKWDQKKRCGILQAKEVAEKFLEYTKG